MLLADACATINISVNT